VLVSTSINIVDLVVDDSIGLFLGNVVKEIMLESFMVMDFLHEAEYFSNWNALIEQSYVIVFVDLADFLIQKKLDLVTL